MNAPQKRTLYILFFAFIFSSGVFRLLVEMLTQQARPPSPPETLAAMRTLCYAMAGVVLLISIGWTLLRTARSNTFPQFQTNMIVSLALSEACSIFGLLLFLLGGSAGEFNRFAIASVLVDLIFILPTLTRR